MHGDPYRLAQHRLRAFFCASCGALFRFFDHSSFSPQLGFAALALLAAKA
jgi:hypothetical protein